MDQPFPPEAVLVVEDEPLVRMVAVDALSDNGLHLYEATDADEALGVLEEHPDIGLVFTDINMPGEMDGLKLVQRIHKLWPKIEIIVTSGRERLLDRQLPDHGSFLAKPYQASKLVDLVRKKMRIVPRLA
jgi:CheY-like chemotaxis protein